MRVRISVARSLLLMLLCGAVAAPAGASGPTITEFQDGLTLKGHPWDLVDGGNGSLWFTQESLRAFGSITAGDGLIGEFTGLLLLGDHPRGISRGPDGNIWIAESGSGGAIARVTPSGAVTEFAAAPSSSQPWDIAAGVDGNLWFVSRDPAFIARMTPNGAVTRFTTGLTPKSQPSAITAGPDGNMWFTESADPGRIGRITPAGAITEYSLGLTPKMLPTDIAAGSDGRLWFTLNRDPGAIGRISTDGEITEFREGLSLNARPTGIAAGPDGAMWFTESASPGRVGRITRLGEIVEYTDGLPAARAPWRIAPGPDGNMWFTENADPGLIARISLPPTVRTRAAGDVADSSALLRGRVRPNAQVTEFHFEYRQGNEAFIPMRSESAGGGWDSLEVSAPLNGLKPNTPYHYRVVATNDSGTTTGAPVSFTTGGLELEPELRAVVVAEPDGPVRYRLPGGRWRRLPRNGAELAMGTWIDTRRGKVRLTTAARGGTEQTGSFGGGVLQVRQPGRGLDRVDIHLRGGNFAACGRPARRSNVVASASYNRRRAVRRLWARDRGGRFRTYGRHSQATVRGTRWLTEDTCAGTLTVVTHGAVVVRDLARRRNVVVTAGHRYFARKRAHGAGDRG